MPAPGSRFIGFGGLVTAGCCTSVGENAGLQLDDVPPENWLPLVRGDYAIDLILRIYAPDLEKFAGWTQPKAEILE